MSFPLKVRLKCETPIGGVVGNVGKLIFQEMESQGSLPAAGERHGDGFRYWTWQEFGADILKAAAFYRARGLKAGDAIGFVSSNGYWRLVTELACMACGMKSVPVFPGYGTDLILKLLKLAEVSLLVSDDSKSVQALKELWKEKCIDLASVPVQLKSPDPEEAKRIKETFFAVSPQASALVMFTSGTSGSPKGVELTHANILSQQKALGLVWRPKRGMRFLSYLPWHHSFGGLFERFFCLSTGGCLTIDDSSGKDIDRLLENYRLVRPEVYFSVPKIYQELVARVLSDAQIEADFFHPDLKFVFTAAAPLPLAISNVFRAKCVAVAEGWGLTETSPCCTLTPLSVERRPGVVGFPIPGVEVGLDESGEILVRGMNVMKGYFKNPDATRAAIDIEGWFHTGDLGDLTPEGLRILSRKDRMFKLSNGEKVFPSEIEERLKSRCKFIKHAYAFGSGSSSVGMLVFPNMDLFGAKRGCLDGSACCYPAGTAGLQECLGACVTELNASVKAGFERVGRLVIVPRDLSVENQELTPSFKLIAKTIESRFGAYMGDCVPADAFVVEAGGR